MIYLFFILETDLQLLPNPIAWKINTIMISI